MGSLAVHRQASPFPLGFSRNLFAGVHFYDSGMEAVFDELNLRLDTLEALDLGKMMKKWGQPVKRLNESEILKLQQGDDDEDNGI